MSYSLTNTLPRYGDLTVFKMAAVRHLGFLKVKLLTVVCRYNSEGHASSCKIFWWSNRCRDGDFLGFKMASWIGKNL